MSNVIKSMKDVKFVQPTTHKAGASTIGRLVAGMIMGASGAAAHSTT